MKEEEYRHIVSEGDVRQTIILVKLLPPQVDTRFDVTARLVSVPFLELLELTQYTVEGFYFLIFIILYSKLYSLRQV